MFYVIVGIEVFEWEVIKVLIVNIGLVKSYVSVIDYLNSLSVIENVILVE